jgi:hypothetical protein
MHQTSLDHQVSDDSNEADEIKISEINLNSSFTERKLSKISQNTSSESLSQEADSTGDGAVNLPSAQPSSTTRRLSADDVKGRWRNKILDIRQRHTSSEREVSWLSWLHSLAPKALVNAYNALQKKQVTNKGAETRVRRNSQSRRVARASF